MPRVHKDKILQLSRSKVMAEVFTPSWICNAQNNLIDSSWFGKANVLNKEILLNVSITLLTEFPEKQFQIFKLKDESGEIKAITNSKVHLELNKSQIYLVTGKIQEYNNTLQLNINQIKLN